jgi:tripartite-type tricarboxylate transporter receptor subunit TctC
MNILSSKSSWLHSLTFGLSALLVAGSLGAQTTYPNRPIRLIVGLAPGGGTDVTARSIAAPLSERLGQSVIVENRVGSGGLIASDLASKSTADGYTLLFGGISHMAIFSSLYKKLPYDPVKDFAPISLAATVPNVLVVNPSIPVNSVSEFIAYAKARPGKVNYGSSGIGSSLHLSMELLKATAGIDVVHIAYKGGALALADLIGGQIQVMFDNLPGQLPMIKAGKVRALAVTTAKRNDQLPQTPTMIESGVAGFEVTVWYGFFAPAKTPAPLINKLHDDIVKVLSLPDVKTRLAQQGADPTPTTPEQFAAFQRSEITKWAKVVKAAGIQPE